MFSWSLVSWVKGGTWHPGEAALEAMGWEWGCEETSPSLSALTQEGDAELRDGAGVQM